MFSLLPLIVLTFVFLNRFGHSHTDIKDVQENDGNFFALVEDKLELKIGNLLNHLTKRLEEYNDENLGKSEIGRILHYNEIKPNLDLETGRGRMTKKMSMAMMPLIFHVGATSTWMILTSIMAVKSVAIGLILLVFKIAVSSAKLASFFTLLKGKSDDHHHHEWSWSPPHYDHHHEYQDHLDLTSQQDWQSYNPQWIPEEENYHTIPAKYRHDDDIPEQSYIEEKN